MGSQSFRVQALNFMNFSQLSSCVYYFIINQFKITVSLFIGDRINIRHWVRIDEDYIGAYLVFDIKIETIFVAFNFSRLRYTQDVLKFFQNPGALGGIMSAEKIYVDQ